MNHSFRCYRTLFWFVLLVAVGMRLGHFFMLHRDPVANIPVLDSASYDRAARMIAFGEGLPKTVYFQAPFYPYFLAAIYLVSNGHPDAIRLVQMLLDILSVLMVISITRTLFNRPAALIAGFLAATYPVLIFQSGLLLKTTLNVLFACLMLHLVLIRTPRVTAVRLTLLGCVTGWAAATQGSVLLQIPLLFLYVVLEAPWHRPSIWLKQWAWLVLGLVIAIGPFTWRNYHVSGRFVLLTAQGGANFYLGNSPYSDGTSKRPPRVRMTPEHEEADFHREAERALGRHLTPEEASAYWTGEALRWIRAHPWDAMKLQLRKLGLFWNKVEIPDNYDFDFYRRYSVWIRYPRYPFRIIGSLGIVGMMLGWRTWRKTWFLYAWIASYCAIWVMFHIYSRYRLPVVAFLMPFVGLAGWSLLLWVREKRVGWLVGAGVVIGITAWGQSLPLTQYTHAQPLFNLGSGLMQRGDAAGARDAWMEALSVTP
ncbi:glycosyltransferase family 39 protein, partial [bacterium]|nr:glycosyltransferase family 39 protein [candidate division CSSED10-310 bacterium]